MIEGIYWYKAMMDVHVNMIASPICIAYTRIIVLNELYRRNLDMYDNRYSW